MNEITGLAATLSTPLEAGDGAQPSRRLFGRDDAHQALLTLLMGFDSSYPPGALLVGESGMGKTRLLQAVSEGVGGLLVTRARLGDKLVPYATLSRWLRHLVTMAPQAMDEATQQAVAPLLREGSGATEPSAAPGGPPKPEVFHALLRRAVPDVVAWALDDLHLADDATAEWLAALLLKAPPTALPWVIATQPPTPGSVAEGVLEVAAGLHGVQTVTLRALETPHVAEWLSDLPATRLETGDAEALAARLMQATAGLPLHLQLLIHEPSPDGSAASTLAHLAPDRPLPALTPLIGERLKRLGPGALALARAAAVTGQDFSPEAVMDFTGLSADEMRQAENDLIEQQLWTDGDFAHVRIREAARQATPDAMARSLHSHCAGWLEAHAGAPARIAAHWQAAGQAARAIEPLRQAAALAGQLRCVAERMACLSRAATLAEEQGQPDIAFICCAEAVEAHTEAVRSTDGSTLLDSLQRLARTPAQLARARTQLAWHAMVNGRLEEAIESGEQALAGATALADESLIAPARQYLGTALGVVGRLDRALSLMQQAEPWVTEHVAPDERASFHSNLAAVLDNLGRADEARPHHQQALTLAARHSDGAHRATLLANYALSRLESGDPLGARELANKAQQLIDAGEAPGSVAGFVAVLMAPCERTLGRYTAALDWCDRAESVLAERNPSRMPVAQLHRAHVWMDMGQHERALALLDGPGLPIGQQLPARHAVRWLLLLARARIRQGDDPRPMLRDAYDRLPSEGWPELELLLRCESSLVLPGADAAEALAQIADEATITGLPAVSLSAWLQCAMLSSAGAQDPELARRAADTALSLMTQGIESTHVDRALRWLAPARALAACGENQRARGLLMRGQQWLQTTAAEQVPPDMARTFLEQHPLNLLLRETPLPPV
jgi:tetratricopeptide (TPR) repeat protein